MLDIIIPSVAFTVSLPLTLLIWFWGSARRRTRDQEARESLAAAAEANTVKTAMAESYATNGHQLWEIQVVSRTSPYQASERYQWVCNCGQVEDVPDSREKDAIYWYEAHQKARNRVKEGKRFV